MSASRRASISSSTAIELLRRSDALGAQSGAVVAGSLARGLLAALPLKLVHDTGHVGLVWREANPGPALASVLQAFVDASKAAPSSGLD